MTTSIEIKNAAWDAYQLAVTAAYTARYNARSAAAEACDIALELADATFRAAACEGEEV